MAAVDISQLRDLVRKYVAQYPARSGQRAIWREPILASAPADGRFEVLPKIADQGHLMPSDLLPSARTVVVFFIPFTQELAEENTGGKFPDRSWGQAYVSTNNLIGLVSQVLQDFLESNGRQAALTPATHNFDPIKLVSRWSHKHLAHLCGLGRYGHHAQLITPVGCCGRLGSLVTDADLGEHPLVSGDELCLHRRGETCLACVKLCPVAALTGDGLDRPRCFERLKFNLERRDVFKDLPGTTHVCAKCQVSVPCSFSAPPVAP